MILNTGSRTDIPAFFSEWFYNRVKEGYVCVRNPYHPVQVTRYAINPSVVDCLVFCTKNPAPMLPRLFELQNFGQYWFVTITPYGKEIEPFVPEKEAVVQSVKKLAQFVGRDRICWRYDPIFLSERYPLKFHLGAFEQMAEMLCGSAASCVISFIDLYEKTLRNFCGVKSVGKEDRHTIGKEFSAIAAHYNIRLKTCAEGNELARYGIDCSGCLTQKVVEEAIGNRLLLPKKNKARTACECLLGNDIGVYNTCAHGCLYCYANYDRKTVAENIKLHDPSSPFLVGNVRPEDVVHIAVQKSNIDAQLCLPFL
jgi:hypothetical protein